MKTVIEMEQENMIKEHKHSYIQNLYLYLHY